MEWLPIRLDLLALGLINVALSVFALFNLLKIRRALGHGVIAEALTALIITGTFFTVVGAFFSILFWYTLSIAAITESERFWIITWLDMIFIIGIVTYVFFVITSRKLERLGKFR